MTQLTVGVLRQPFACLVLDSCVQCWVFTCLPSPCSSPGWPSGSPAGPLCAEQGLRVSAAWSSAVLHVWLWFIHFLGPVGSPPGW